MLSSYTIPLIKPIYRGYFKLVDRPSRRAFNGLLINEKPLFRDISSHQKRWNAMVSKANGVWGALIRSSWGLVKDEYYSINESLAISAGLFHSSYHALYPNLSWMDQLDIWYQQHPTPPVNHLPRVLDVEVLGGMSYAAIGDICLAVSDEILSRDGLRPIIYSRAGLINAWFSNWSIAELDSHYYWLAQYLTSGAEHPGPVTLPNRVNRRRVLWHQTSSHKVDFPGEVDSLSVDWSRWELGTITQMLTWIKEVWNVTQPVAFSNWYTDIDVWARTKGFASMHRPY